MAKTYKIYTLSSLTGYVFYVGVTMKPLKDRLSHHLTNARMNNGENILKNRIIKMLKFQVIIKEVDRMVISEVNTISRALLSELELEWTQRYLKLGFKLTNAINGRERTTANAYSQI